MKYIFLLLIGLAGFGCHTNVDEFIPYPIVPGAGERFAGDFFANATVPVTSYPLNLDENNLVQTPMGTQIELTAGTLLLPDGTPATGSAELLVEELPQLGDRIRYRRVSLDETGALIGANGQIQLQFQQNGTALTLADAQGLTLRLTEENPVTDEPRVFTAATVSLPDDIQVSGWQPAPDVAAQYQFWETPTGEYEGFQLTPRAAGWWQVGDYVDPDLPRTTLCAAFEPSYAAENTVVFALFPELRAVVELYNTDDDGIFCLENMPVGQAVDYLAIAEKADDTYELAQFTSTTIVDQRVDLVPVPKSLDGILEILDQY